MNEHDLERLLEDLAATTPAPAFRAGFGERVMARVYARAHEDSALLRARALRCAFVRVAPAALAASLVLAAYNLASAGGASQRSPLEALLGLPEVSLDAAYALDVTPFGY